MATRVQVTPKYDNTLNRDSREVYNIINVRNTIATLRLKHLHETSSNSLITAGVSTPGIYTGNLF